MPPMVQFLTTLDAFVDKLEVKRVELKREIDQRIDELKGKVKTLANNIRRNTASNRRDSRRPPLSVPEIKEEIKQEDDEFQVVTVESVESISNKAGHSRGHNLDQKTRKQSKRNAKKKAVRINDNSTEGNDQLVANDASELENEAGNGVFKLKVKYLNCCKENCPARLKSLKEYYQHIKQQHNLGKYTCWAKDCIKRFHNKKPLWEHFNVYHQSINDWSCGKCSSTLSTHQTLSVHMYQHHQEGKFLCAHTGCHFTANNRQRIFRHQLKKHQIKSHVCQYDECGKSFKSNSDLACHERIHLANRPFSCTWLHCEYSSTQRQNAVSHIRTCHFKLPKTVKAQAEQNIVDDRDANEYIRVNEDLAQRRLT